MLLFALNYQNIIYVIWASAAISNPCWST